MSVRLCLRPLDVSMLQERNMSLQTVSKMMQAGAVLRMVQACRGQSP